MSLSRCTQSEGKLHPYINTCYMAADDYSVIAEGFNGHVSKKTDVNRGHVVRTMQWKWWAYCWFCDILPVNTWFINRLSHLPQSTVAAIKNGKKRRPCQYRGPESAKQNVYNDDSASICSYWRNTDYEVTHKAENRNTVKRIVPSTFRSWNYRKGLTVCDTNSFSSNYKSRF